MPYCVRLMRREDIIQVIEIDREAFPTQWPPPNYQHELQNQLARYIVACDETRTVEEPKPRSGTGLYGLASRVRNWFDRSHAIVSAPPLTSRPYIVGFAGIWILADESHLTNIAVRKSYQRQGVGELLLICTIELSARLNADSMTLEVRVSNTPAQGLYSKYGFTQAGLRRGYYTDNREDAMLMSTESINSALFQARYQQLKQSHSRRWGEASCELISNHPVPPGRR